MSCQRALQPANVGRMFYSEAAVNIVVVIGLFAYCLAPVRNRQHPASMCNLYSMTSTQQEVRELARTLRDITGNMPPLPGIFPDYQAPIVRNTPEGRELADRKSVV